MPRQLRQVTVHARPVAIWVVNGTLYYTQIVLCDVFNGTNFGLAIHTCLAVDERGQGPRILISMCFVSLVGAFSLLTGLVLALTLR